MLTKHSLIRAAVLFIIIALVMVGSFGYSTVTASPRFQDNDDDDGQAGGESVVTVTGYATQYVDDDEVMFTDGTHTVKLEVPDNTANQVPLNTPFTITAKVESDDGKLKLDLISAKPAEGGNAGAAAPSGDLPVKTIAEIQSQPVNNQNVAVRGQITQKISDEKYLLSDGTGMIVLDFDKNVPADAIPLNNPVTVFGRIDVDDGRVEIDVTGIQPAS